MDLLEFAQIIDEELIISFYDRKFHVMFKNSEIKENKDSRSLIAASGVGYSVEEAMKNYWNEIQGNYLVFDAMDKNRRMRGVPKDSQSVEMQQDDCVIKKMSYVEMLETTKDIMNGVIGFRHKYNISLDVRISDTLEICIIESRPELPENVMYKWERYRYDITEPAYEFAKQEKLIVKEFLNGKEI